MSIKISRLAVPLAMLAMLGGATLPQAWADEAKMTMPGDMTWMDGPPVLPSGVQMTPISGNPGEKGLFVLRLKFPAGYEIPAHTHSTTEFVTVISGTLNFGHGEALDRNATNQLPAGGFVEIPAGHPHFVWTEDEVVVQLHGEGPFTITYVDAADDPRNKQASK